ncbi:hypothetical protein KPH14_003872 [Odynerus spinipes]|uniref:Sodium channel protein Nach n=1 Tax=Odynerus spinipes TaxID=1348599 RepID=A0AAD9VUY2_9HYME|nr:hypothetical protein KPH14_003872 [Odynerus spinipes]
MPKTVMIVSSVDERFKKTLPPVRNAEKGMIKKRTSDVVLKKVSFNRKKRVAREILQDFADSSSVHGMKYLLSQTLNTSCLGRSLWICTMIAAIIGVDTMIKTFWQYLEENPVNLYIDSLHAPIFLAAFPAVSICPNLPTTVKRQYELLNSIKLPENMTTEEAMVFLKHGTSMLFNKEYLARLDLLLQENQWRLVDFLRLLKPCEDMIDSCWWHGKRINCTDHIKQTHAYNGICCSFNYYLEDVIKYNKEFRKIPVIHTARSGPKSGLTVIFDRDLFAEDNSTGDVNSNFVNSIKLLIFVHHSASYPNAETVGYTLQKGQGLRLSVQPSIMMIPSNVAHGYLNGTLQPMCIPNSQKSELRFFPEYRHSNCFANCRITNLLDTCGCIRYLYAPMANYSQVPLCELPDFKCVFNFARNKAMVNYENCYCLRLCEDLTYQSTTTKYSLEASSRVALSPIFKNLSNGQAALSVHMKMDTFKIYRTEASFNYWNTLADIGGIFSLCLGCSILSAVEIVYFIYLFCRAICTKKRIYN